MKIAVVTGAAGGLGRAISAKLMTDGLHVVGIDIDAGALVAMASANFTAVPVDLTDPAAITTAFAQIGKQFGGIDALYLLYVRFSEYSCVRAGFADVSEFFVGLSLLPGSRAPDDGPGRGAQNRQHFVKWCV